MYKFVGLINELLLKAKLPCSPALLLSLLLLAMSLFNHWKYASSTPTTDFFTYWGVPRTMRSTSVHNIYNHEDQRTMLSILNREAEPWSASKKQMDAAAIASRFYGQRIDVTGSPFLYASAGLLSTGSYERDQRHFVILCFLCLAASILILCRLLKYHSIAAILMLIFFSSFFAPVLSDLEVGNVNQIQLLIITMFILLTVKSKSFWAGFVIGMGIAFKPNIALIWLCYHFYELVDREYKKQITQLLGTVAGMLLAVSFSVVYFGKPAIWVQYAATFPAMLTSSYPVYNGNKALPMLISDLTGLHTAAIIGGVLIIAFTGILLLTRCRIHAEATVGKNSSTLLHKMFNTAGIGCVIMLLSSNLAWLHYYILLIPLAIYLLRPAESEAWSGPSSPFMQTAVRLAATAALLLFSSVMSFVLNNAQSQAVVFNIATGLLLLGALYELWSVRMRSRAG